MKVPTPEANQAIVDMPDIVMVACLMAGGVLLGFCFDQPALANFAWIALVPFAIASRCCRVAAVSLGAFAGFFSFFLIGLRWMYETGHPEAYLWWPATALTLAFVMLPVIWVTRFMAIEKGIPLGIAFPMAWIGFEYLRYCAAYSPLEEPFPFLQLGATQAHHIWLVQIGDLCGVWGVSAIVAALNAVIAEFVSASIHRRGYRGAMNQFLGLVGVLLAIVAYGQFRLSREFESGPRVALVADQFPSKLIGREDNGNAGRFQGHFRDRLASSQSSDAEVSSIDLWVWTEGALRIHRDTHSFKHDEQESFARLVQLSQELKSTLVMGMFRVSSTKTYDSLLVFNPNLPIEGCYDKHYLGPTDEFQPRVCRVLSKLTGLAFGDPKSIGFSPLTFGNNEPVFSCRCGTNETCKFAGAICYDGWFSSLFRAYFARKQGERPDFFVLIAHEVGTGERTDFNYNWWALVEAQFRAIETRRSVIRCCGDGYSAVVDPCGRLLSLVGGSYDSKPIIVNSVPINHGRTLYSMTGDWLPVLATAVCVWGLAAMVLRPFRRKQQGNRSEAVQ